MSAISSQTVNVKNVLVGAGVMFISDLDTALPSWTSGERAEDTLISDTNWTEVGATQEGVEIGYEPDIGEVEVDQMMDAAKLFWQGLNVTMNTQLVEATLENLMVAWGAPDSALDGDEFSIGSPGADPVERSAAVVGLAPATQDTFTNQDQHRERIYHARRIVAVEGSNHSLARTEATVFPASFRLLPLPESVDGSTQYTGSEYGKIIDRLYDGTAS